MHNRPFFANITNVTDEGRVTTTPTTFGANNLLVTQGQQRKIYDTTTTSIQGNMFTEVRQQNYNPQQMIRAEKHCTPFATTFTFNPQLINCACHEYKPQANFIPPPIFNQFAQVAEPTVTLEQRIAMTEAEKQRLESILMQEQVRNGRYQLRFHENRQTSTTDFFAGEKPQSKGLPDFESMSSALQQAQCTCRCHGLVTNNYSQARQLNLTKSPDLTATKQEIVVNNLQNTTSSTQTAKARKKLSFQDEQLEKNRQRKDQSPKRSTQTPCRKKINQKRKTSPVKKKKTYSYLSDCSENSSSDSSTESIEDCDTCN